MALVCQQRRMSDPSAAECQHKHNKTKTVYNMCVDRRNGAMRYRVGTKYFFRIQPRSNCLLFERVAQKNTAVNSMSEKFRWQRIEPEHTTKALSDWNMRSETTIFARRCCLCTRVTMHSEFVQRVNAAVIHFSLADTNSGTFHQLSCKFDSNARCVILLHTSGWVVRECVTSHATMCTSSLAFEHTLNYSG